MNQSSKKNSLSACVCVQDETVANLLESLLGSTGYFVTTIDGDIPDLRQAGKHSKDLLVFNIDALENIHDEKLRAGVLRELMRSQDLSEAKIIAISNDIQNEKHLKFVESNKIDSFVSIPLDATAFNSTLQELKGSKPKRSVWRSSWK